MHVLYLGVLYGTARAALVRKSSYLGLSDEKMTVPFVPFIPIRSVHSDPFRSVPGFSTTHKSTHISTTKVTFSTNFYHSSQCMVAITAVYLKVTIICGY